MKNCKGKNTSKNNNNFIIEILPALVWTLINIVLFFIILSKVDSYSIAFIIPVDWFAVLVSFYKRDISNFPVLLKIKAWVSIFVFILFGIFITNIQVTWDVPLIRFIIVLLIGFLIFVVVRNSAAFIKSYKLRNYDANLEIALANIFHIIIVYAIIYNLFYSYSPNSFDIQSANTSIEEFFNFLYFSFITFTTLGYGDITPTHIITKFLVMTEVSVFLSIIGISVIFIKDKDK